MKLKEYETNVKNMDTFSSKLIKDMFTIQLKIMFQRIGKFDIDWDDSIDEFSVEWKKICGNLKRCEEIAIKSYFIYDISDTIEEVFWMLRNQLTQHAFIYNQ